MATAIILILGVIIVPIVFVIVLYIKNGSEKGKKDQSANPQVNNPGTQQMTCPRCGSPVIQYRDGWECGWCGDSCRW